MIEPDLIAFAHRLADAARPIVKAAYRSRLAFNTKLDRTPVTEADRAAERIVRNLIETHRPVDGFIGEETGSKSSMNGYTWVVDPIDGTKAFICGKPLFGTLIALLKEDKPVLGILDQPVLEERWIGAKGHPTLLNGLPCKTSACTALAQARLATTGPGNLTFAEWALFQALGTGCAVTGYGGDCYNYALLASGFIDLVAEANLKLYDYAALIPIIEGAGGIVTGWNGQAIAANHDGTLLAAATPELHRAALAILGKAR
jgi:histidinol phosphatase-like enzyme (inositol monophosphatase family)